jgi:hypothetical protein
MKQFIIETKSSVYLNEARKAYNLALLFKKLGKHDFYNYYLSMAKSKKEFSNNLMKGLFK